MSTKHSLDGLVDVIDLNGGLVKHFRRDTDRIVANLHAQTSSVFSPRMVLETTIKRLSERGYVGARIWAKDGKRYKLVAADGLHPELLAQGLSFYPKNFVLERILNLGKMHYFYDVTKVPPLFTGEFDPLEVLLGKHPHAVSMLVVPYDAHSLNPGLQDFQGVLVVNVDPKNHKDIKLNWRRGKPGLGERDLVFLKHVSNIVAEKVIRIMEYNRRTRTGLYDADKLERDLKRYLDKNHEQGSEYSFGIIDLDNFKSINTNYGYLTGNKVIDGMARILTDVEGEGIRTYNPGGDEFGFIINGGTEKARGVAETISTEFPTVLDSLRLPVLTTSPSIGIASVSQQINAFDEWYGHANNALNKAKELGKNRVVVHGQ